MLIGNYSVLNKHPGRDFAGGATGLGLYRASFNKTSPMRNIFLRDGFATQPTLKSGIPNGYLPPYSWCLPQKAGGLASHTTVTGTNTSSMSIAGGLNGQSSLSGIGTLSNVNLVMIMWLISTLQGSTSSDLVLSGTIPAFSNMNGSGTMYGDVYSLIELLSTISSEGNVTGDVLSIISAISSISGIGYIQQANLISTLLSSSTINASGQLSISIVGVLQGFANLEGDSFFVSSIQSLAHMIGQILSAGNISNSSITAIGKVSAEVTPFSELSPQSLATSVWNAVASAYNTTGTMGYKLNNVSTGGGGGGSLTQEEHDKLMSIVDDFGDEVLENGLTVYETLRIMLSVLAGKSSHTNTTVTFRNNLDSKNRVVANVEDDGDRTSVSLDGT